MFKYANVIDSIDIVAKTKGRKQKPAEKIQKVVKKPSTAHESENEESVQTLQDLIVP